MYSTTRTYDMTPPVLLLMSLFVFGLEVMLPPSCKCPNGFTYPQCNFTNMVCLTQTMFVRGELHAPAAHLPNHKGDSEEVRRLTKGSVRDDILYSQGDSLSVLKMSKADKGGVSPIHVITDNDERGRATDDSSKKQSTLKSSLLLYNAYPAILFAIAALLSIPCALWKYAAVEKDIHCILNTFTFAGSHSTDEKSRLKCIEQCVNDIKFFLRFFHGNLYKNVRRMYLLKVIIPVVVLLTLTFILNINIGSVFSFHLSGLYSMGQSKFPSDAMCHFKILSRSTTRSYTTPCSLPASPLLQLLTPLLITWMTFLMFQGLYKSYIFRNNMSTANQNRFYRRHGFNPETANSVSAEDLFGRGGFLLFTTVAKSDSANILPEVLRNLRAPLEANPIEN